MLSLSILDQVLISSGQSSTKTLSNSIELAKLADTLGYKRYWIAEHHSSKYFANSTPEILMSSIASQTKNIVVGSGGILLNHYSPYKIAENLRLLEALYPNRIDAGFGRASGGEVYATQALQGENNSVSYDLKINQVVNYLTKKVEIDNDLIVSPIITSYPEVWLLGSSMKTAKIAANQGLSFAFGHFLTPGDEGSAIEYYLSNFKPSLVLKEPKVALCINVICADSEDKCQELAKSQDAMSILINRGLNPDGIPSPKELANLELTEEEKELIKNSRNLILGTPQKVKEEILSLCSYYKADEIIILTNTYNHRDKLHSYKLIMDVMQDEIEIKKCL